MTETLPASAGVDPEPGDRGRAARRAGDIPARGWKDILVRTLRQVKQDDVPTQSAAIAFYALLALFPAIIALVSVYGMVADPRAVSAQLDSVVTALPEDAGNLVITQLRAVTRASGSGLGVGAVLGIAAALWTASGGGVALVKGLDVAYGERQTRGFVKLRGLALLLTLAGVVALVAMMGLIVALPSVLDRMTGGAARSVALLLRWPLLACLLLVALAVLYRFGPDRRNAEWRWVTWGAAVAMALWLLASVGFSLYVSLLGNYNKTYGSIGAVIVLMLWLYLAAFSILFGAEINAEMERQTTYDTTEGARPMGQRDAYAADTLGEPAGR